MVNTLNEIVVSGWRVSFTLVGQLSDWWRRIQRNKALRNEENRNDFSGVKHRHDNPVASFDCALVNKSIVYITVRKQKAPSTCCLAAKHPKHNKLWSQTLGEEWQ